MKAEGVKGRVWWYLDGEYIGVSDGESTFFHAVPDGEHIISAADEAGRSSAVSVRVFTPGRREQGDLLF